jgi:hypothetical protein
MRVKFNIMAILLFATVISSAAERRITWEPVAGAAGYFLEIKDSAGNITVSTTVSENFYPVSKLEPGAYSFRIATVNILKQQGESTQWIDFVIERLYIPELKSVSPGVLISSYMNKNIVVKGKNLKPGAKLFLRGNGKEIELTDIEVVPDNEVVFNYKPDSSLKGKYDLVLINRGDAESVLKDVIEITEPEAAETICFIGAAYSINKPFGVWADYYALSYTGADIFFQFSGRNMGYENILFEAELEVVRFSNGDLLKKSTLTYTAFGIGSGYYYPIAGNSIDLYFKLQGGGLYTSVTLDESPDDKSVASIDVFLMAGAGVRAWISESFFIDSSCGWKTIFYAGEFMNDIRVTLGCGLKY